MKTFSAKPHEVQHDWYLVDAADKILGRLASQIVNGVFPVPPKTRFPMLTTLPRSRFWGIQCLR